MNRREIIKGTVLTGAMGALSMSNPSDAQSAESNSIPLNIAGYAYDRVRAIQDGRLGLDGYTIAFHVEDIYHLNQRIFGSAQNYEVSEVGFVPFVKQYVNQGFRAYSLIPVFISRLFRHRNIFVRADSDINQPEDLRGKRIATPGYGMSACTWIRGLLQDCYGIKPEEMNWIETTVSSDGGLLQRDKLGKYLLPDDFPLEQGPPGVDESQLLVAGDVDAIISAITPKAYLEGNSGVKRLFADVRSAEQDYFKQTGIFPIMHAIAIRTDIADAYPDLPDQVFQLYCQAKQLAYHDLETTTSLKITLPWVTQEFEDTQALMGKNFWPYGVEANRKTLERLMRYTYEQGLTRHQLDVDEIFHPSTLSLNEAA